MISPNSGPQGSRQSRPAPRNALFAGMVCALVATGVGVARQIQMRLHRSRRFLLALAFAAVALPQAASAVVIGFHDLADGDFDGPNVEDGFVYELLLGSGKLRGLDAFGNPEPHMEGNADVDGGTLSIRLAGGGLFFFHAADISNWLFWDPTPQVIPSRQIDFVGWLNGIPVGTDKLFTDEIPAAPDMYGDVWVTRSSDKLAGRLIDELRVVLDAGPVQEWAESVDNIVVTIDAPAPLALLGVGAAALGYRRRRGRRA